MRLRALPLLEGQPLDLRCANSVQGEGLNAQGARGVGAVRVQLFSVASDAPVYDRTVEITGSTAGVRLDDIAPGDDLHVLASVCTGPGQSPLWVGQGQDLSIKAGQTETREVVLLPTAGWACASDDDLPAQALAFASAWSPEGRNAYVAGGFTSWAGPGAAQASADISRYERASSSFVSVGALPAPMGFAQHVRARPAPDAQEALLLIGGVSSLVEGDQSAASALLHFGPASARDVQAPVWVDARGVATRANLTGLPRYFAPGVGASFGVEGDRVLVAGGVAWEPDAKVSNQAFVVHLDAQGPSVETITMASPRLAPKIVQVQEGVFLIVGGNTGHESLEDPKARATLMDWVDTRTNPTTVLPVTIDAVPGWSDLLDDLVVPSSFASAWVAEDGHVLVAGGLPAFGGSQGRPIGRGPVLPVLYRIQVDLTQPGMVTLDTPLEATNPFFQSATQRAMAVSVVSEPGQELVFGGVANDPTAFKPAGGSFQVDLAQGWVTLGDAPPYAPVGASVARFWDGSRLTLGGLVESGSVNQLQVTNLAVLRRGQRVDSCGAFDDAP